MSESSIKKISENVKSIIEKENFELEYVEEVKELERRIIRIVIDKPEGTISADDCEKVSRLVEDTVDKLMPDKEYVLEVSSAGLEKTLKNLRLYKKYIGKEASVKLFKKTKLTNNIDEKEITAVIFNVDTEKEIITFKKDKEVFSINIKDIASAHTTFDFDALLKNS